MARYQDAPYIADLDACPACGAGWRYEKDGATFSYLIGIYSRGADMTVAWRCPACATEWPRGTRIDRSDSDA